jgi:hypothetical protein
MAPFASPRTRHNGPPPEFVDQSPERVHCACLDPRTAPRRPRRHDKLTMSIPATSENVASPHCSDEPEANSQKPEHHACGVAYF